MAWIEVWRRQLAFQFRPPQIVPAVELDAFYQVGAVTDRIDVRPRAEMIRTDAGFIGEILGIRNLGKIQFLEQAIVRVEPADVRRRESNIAFGIGFGELSLVE